MVLLTYQTDRGTRLAAKTSDGVFETEFADVHQLLEDGEAPALGARLDEAALQLAPCVTRPSKIVCVGLNYREHAKESNMALPAAPVLFSKFNSSLAAGGEPVPLPEAAREYDYEAELALVIGRRARSVSERDALDHVWGYCNANDLSARDLQFVSSQWLLGKALDKFLPLGPYLCSSGEVPDLDSRFIRCWVNGELRQDSTLADMIFGVPEIVSYVSRYMTLEPGDVISTGTPPGVIQGMARKRWLKPGDEVVVEVEGLGRLTTPLVAP